MSWKKQIHRLFLTTEKTLYLLAAALALTILLFNIDFQFLEAKLYDFRMTAASSGVPADPRIVLIALDHPTTKALNEFSPLPLDYHTRLLEKLASDSGAPKAVGYLINMNHVNQVQPELFDRKWGQRFVEAALRLESKGTPVILGTPFDVSGEVLPPYPLSSLEHAIAVIHRDGNVFASDHVSRRALTSLYGKPTFHLLLAQSTGLVQPQWIPSGTFEVPQVDGRYFFFRYHGNTAIGDDLSRSPYVTYSFVDVLEGRVPPGAFAGRVVLIGSVIRENPGDFALTPYSKAAFTSPKLLVHGSILDSILHDDGIRAAPVWINGLITWLAASLIFWFVLKTTPLLGILVMIGLAGVIVGIGYVVFQGPFGLPGLWIEQTQPLIGIVLAYYLAVPYRLLREYKKRWEYQRKNDLLLQVEEMKTNFLSLVTHDLKTPVARIQGLSEMISSKASQRLTEDEKGSLHQIVHSTDELNHFISSILELAKIESNRVQLRLESKDVNRIVELCLERLETSARARGIRLEHALEPLFPIRLDPSLISKVVSNMIDNAIKYSPEGSTVRIQTREVDQSVEISVTDQGIGMSEEELQQLFTKFYRAKNDTTTRVSGTGLGLYLSRYFVEAHSGRLIVDSIHGQGSTFSIRLPIEQPRPEAAKPKLTPVFWNRKEYGDV